MERRARLTAILLFASAFAVSGAFGATSTVPSTDLTPLFATSGVDVQDLRVTEVGGIVIIRGRALDPARAADASVLAKNLGYLRVANLIRVVPPADDAKIERIAEREISIHRGMEGSRIRIDSQNGVVRLRGTVTHELQKDAAVALVRSIDGVREVRSDLSRP